MPANLSSIMPVETLARSRQRRQGIDDRERQQIIRNVIALGKTKAEVARAHNRSYSTISTVIQTFLNTGRTTSIKKKGGAFRGSAINKSHIRTICDFVAERPGATLVEINEHLASKAVLASQNFDFNVEGNWDNAIYFDEAGFNLLSHRAFGRSPVGERVLQRNRPANREVNMSLMVAVSGDGIVASYTILGGWTGDYVALFLQEFLFPLIKGQSRLLLFDNAKCHHTGTVEAIVAHKGHRIQFIPPYSPWLNPTERVFGCIRPAIGREDLKDHGTLKKVIEDPLSLITSEQAKGWIRETKKWARVASAGYPLNQDHDADQALARYNLAPDLSAPFIDNEQDSDEEVSQETMSQRVGPHRRFTQY
ncbi:hypothetical protein PANT_27c00064 [Moesziomyces antarcticus T-34]|uniref:Tc1-like transposase DDE domain-containing protein n=1 Tax=Pseudozyma antarctica (strain T-34) TaxID=1151754 RepID=M9LTF0_PSEA3|nr:hypothetical protein PANT_27c00064 [Moesziomyces antarcticus T-34]